MVPPPGPGDEDEDQDDLELDEEDDENEEDDEEDEFDDDDDFDLDDDEEEGGEDDEDRFPPGKSPSAAEALIVPVAPGRAPSGPVLPPRPARQATADDESYGDQPGAIAPQARKKRHEAVVKTKSTRRLNPGDRICGECGEGNAPTRKFCSRCGTSLASADVVKDPWWRRLLPKPKTLKAGGRPGQPGVKVGRHLPELSRILRPVRWVVGVFCLLIGILYATYHPFNVWANNRVGSAEHAVSSRLHPQPVSVRPDHVTANAELPGHEGKLAVDLNKTTYWAAPNTIPNPTLTMTFDKPVNLDWILVTSGVQDDFTNHDNPEQLHLRYSNGKSDDVTLTDDAAPQQKSLHNGHGITSVEVQITSTFKADGGKDVAVTELELDQKK